MRRVLGRFIAIFIVAWRRLVANRRLTIAELVGVVAVLSLALAVPMYADAVYHRVMVNTLGLNSTSGTRLPAFAFMFRYVPFSSQPVTLADTARADQFVTRELPNLLGLPNRALTRYYQTTNLRLFPADESGTTYDHEREPLLRIPITSLTDFDKHIRVVEGHLPALAASDGPVEVLVSKSLADLTGLQIGDRLFAVSGQSDYQAIQVPVRIAGTWEPTDPYEVYWFYRPSLLEQMLLVPEGTLVGRVGPALQKNLAEVLWLSDFDGSSVRVWGVPGLVERIKTVTRLAGDDAVNLSVSASPLSRLQSYQEDSSALMLRLYALSVPLFVLAFAFVLLVANQRASSQRNETAVLRSRGATRAQVLAITLVQSCILVSMGFILATPVAMFSAQWMGKARSFFQFTGTEWLPVSPTPTSAFFGLLAAGISVVMTVLPMLEVSAHTIVSQKLERARALRAPWWQRAGLDLLLLIPAGYGTYLLRRQGYVDIPGLASGAGDPFNNPSLFIVAVTSMLGLTLLFIRCLPLLLRLLAAVLGHLPGTSTVLAFRQLARSPGYYTAPVLLLALTLGLAIFTSSMAATLDRQLDQETYFSVGADARLVGTGQDNRAMLASTAAAPADDSGQVNFAPDRISGRDTQKAEDGPRWVFLPISDYAQVGAVRSATRLGRYPLSPQFSVGDDETSQFIGIDRDQFARTTFWRTDFATQPLGALMNALAGAPDGVLISEETLHKHVLGIGDQINVTVALPDSQVHVAFKVVGTYKSWPTALPDDKTPGPAFVGNLDYLFEQAGGQAPYDVLLSLASNASPADVEKQLRQVDHSDWDYRNARELIEREQTQPARQGLFGLLSAGIITAIILTVLGLFLYYAFSFRRRFVEFGVLRALGFNQWQMALSLAWELAVLFLAGVGAGSALGFGASALYLPLLQGPAIGVRHAVPLLVLTDAQRLALVYGAVSVLSAVALAGLLLFLRRLNIFQAIKLGETE
jgi:putative ABC transport system permease protein